MILAGYPSRNVDILDEKRDKQALGLALVTVPISIVGALSGADAASAQQPPIIEDSNNNTDTSSGSQKVVAAATPILTTATQLSYTVKAGDTVSSIARKFQLSTNQLLTLNNLDAKSLIVR